MSELVQPFLLEWKHGKFWSCSIEAKQNELYKALKNEFDTKLNVAAKKYLDKNVEELKNVNPGRAYKTLKRMGAQPGDCNDSGSFNLPSHAGYSALESAECIADHFANISGTFPPLSVGQLPSPKMVDGVWVGVNL